ncbi:MAG: biopolymer transporter ExbD [Rickettsiales bacterium]|nr:biopolymer transporter ExbD [Rickettsiales bacterium]|tara:strand:+ start:1315 stop:1755 length:441 start_codon:yes stop_codon:yes gene_type:complete
MAFVTRKKKGPQADINVTPLVDIVLVLLIIFMVITPMLQRGAEVKLPPAVNAESKEDSGEATIISVKEDGSMYLGKDLITPDLLERELNAILLTEPFKFILIKGDAKAQYGAVRKAMEICEKVGAKSVALQTDQAESSGLNKDKKG